MPDRSEWHPSLQARWDRNEIVMGREFESDPADSPHTAPPAVGICSTWPGSYGTLPVLADTY